MFLTSTIKFSNKTSTAFRLPSDFSPYTTFDYSSIVRQGQAGSRVPTYCIKRAVPDNERERDIKMKTPLIAAAALLTLSGIAHAETSVSIYGIVDAGLVRESGGAEGNVTALGGGVASGSRLGFRGKEDLGSGLSANFLLENGFNSDNGTLGQGGLLFGRQMYVGLSGDFGAVRMGRQYSPYYLALRDVADPFAAGLAGRAGNIMVTNTRVNNMINYLTPQFAGFVADLAYGLGEVA